MPVSFIISLIPLLLFSGNISLPSEFHSASTCGDKKPVKIGLLISNRSYNESVDAARLALDQANIRGGYKGRQFELVVRTTEGPWGAGSKESVALVYEDSVVAMLIALDGRNAHLAEQVAAKSHILCLSTCATEPTLTQAYVPWFMRCIPNDNQQAEAIIEIIIRNGGGRIVILSSADYDAQYAVRSLIRKAAGAGIRSPVVVAIDSKKSDVQNLVRKLIDLRPVHLVIPSGIPHASEVVKTLKQRFPDLQMYGTLGFTGVICPGGCPQWNNYEEMVLVTPGCRFTRSGQIFREQFSDTYGTPPGKLAAYAFDATNLVIEAICQTGPDREYIKDYLREIKYRPGVAGSISFDEMGNRTGPVRLMKISNSIPVLIE